MPARLIVYQPDDAAIIRLIRTGQALRVGRVRDDASIDLPAPGQPSPSSRDHLLLDHPSVSRAHAELQADGDHWRLLDLGSKNGTHVDGMRTNDVRLPDACWLRFGDVYCEFALLSEAEAEAAERDRRDRRHAATAHTQRLQKLTRLGDLLDTSLDAVLGLAQCERGFVLLGDGSGFVVSASRSLAPEALASRAFSGSVGVVQRALDQRRIVVANDVGSEAWLATRQSVVAAGISALVCLPLMDDDRVLGAIYADRVTPGPAINTLDLELLQAFAENAAMWIAARRTSEQLANRAAAPDRSPAGQDHAECSGTKWSRIIAAHPRPGDESA